MKVFIANCTLQFHHLSYRLLEHTGLITQPIDTGRQVQVPRELNVPQMEALIQQLRVFGLLTVDEAKGGLDRDQQVVYLMSADRPVDTRLLERIMQHNKGALFLRGKDMRQKAAIAASGAMGEQAHTPGAANRMESSIEQVSGEGMGSKEQFEEGYRIGDGPAPEGTTGDARGKGRSKGR